MERLTAEKIAKNRKVQSLQRNKAVFVSIWLYSILLFALFSAVPASAANTEDSFKQGNALYAEGKFSDAAQKYQTAADGGLAHWTLEYNLGNAYWRAGQIGKAILHYERAFRLNSGQKDVLYNLNLATTKVGEPEMPVSALPALAWRLFYILPIDTLTIITSLLFFVLCGVAGMILFFSLPSSSAGSGGGSMDPRQWHSGMTTLMILPFVFVGIWLGARIYLLELPEGIVVSPVAEVRSGPSLTYPANFTVPEGHRVLILKEQEPIQGWLEIGVPDQGLKGWVPTSSVETL